MTIKRHPIVIVQGAQWGSEAKGAVAHSLCRRLGVTYPVRTGSINAGHTVQLENGSRHVFQQLPTGSLWPWTLPVLGPGAYVSPDLYRREVEMAGCDRRVIVDRNCGVHLPEHTEEATGAARNLKIGATGKGCAESVIHKIKDRGVGIPLLFRERTPDDLKVNLVDTANLLTEAYDHGHRILIEGTQGSLLDLHTGPYPFVTSRQSISSAWVAEAGLSPALDYEVALVVRTYPIRVAGPSGPMPREITWPDLARRMNARLARFSISPVVPEESLRRFEEESRRSRWKMQNLNLSPAEVSLKADTEAILSMPDEDRAAVLSLFETTTVTKRLRRVAELDLDLLRATVRKERPAYLVVTFLNYVFPELRSARRLHSDAMEYLSTIESYVGCRVKYTSVGPTDDDILVV